MGITSSEIFGKTHNFLAAYVDYPDLYIAAPSREFVRMGHVTYTTGHVKRGHDIFLCTDEISFANPVLNLQRPIGEVGEQPELIDRLYGIRYQFVEAARPFIPELKNKIRWDVHSFFNNPAKKPVQTMQEIVGEIIPRTKVSWSTKLPYLTTGKQESVPACLFGANLDYANDCETRWLPGERASFDGEYFVDYYLNPGGACLYCYSDWKHHGKAFPKGLRKIDQDELRDEILHGFKDTGGKWVPGPIKLVRLGKQTEAGSAHTIDQLIASMEVFEETKTAVIHPTKSLKYDPYLARLYRNTESVILFSEGYPKHETGALKLGHDTDYKREQLIKFKLAGVKVVYYPLVDATSGIGSREREFITLGTKYDIPVQFLALNVTTERVAREILRRSLAGLKSGHGQNGMFGDNGYGGYKRIGNKLYPEFVHQDWKKLWEDNQGSYTACFHNDKETYCGGCGKAAGRIMPTQHIKIKYTKQSWKKRKKMKMPLLKDALKLKLVLVGQKWPKEKK